MTAQTAGQRPVSPWRVASASPALRRILLSFAVSKIGDTLYATALLVVVLERTGSAGWVSAALIAHLSPAALVSPLAGVLADRMDRRRLMVMTDTGRLVLMCVAALLVASGAPTVLLLVVAFASSCVGTPFMSALMGLTPEVLPEDRLPAANAAVQALWSVGYLVGPALATLLLHGGPLWLPFAINAGTFAVSATSLSGVRLLREPAGTPAPQDDGGTTGPGEQPEHQSFGAAFVEGLRVVLSHPGLRVVAVTIVPSAMAWGMTAVLMPLVSRDLLGTGASGLGLLTAASGLGGVLGAGMAARLASRDRLLIILSGAILAGALPVALLSVVHVPVLAYAIMLIDGLALITIEVVWMTALQRMLPLRQVARVDSLFMSLNFGLGVLGNLVAPLLVEVTGLRPALLITFGLGAAGALAGVVMGSTVETQVADRALLDVLRRIRALDGVGEAGYEALVRAASDAETVPAGTGLLAAWEPATQVLILVSGTVDVLGAPADGGLRIVNTVAGPDLLGEIGVLGRRPRTATVITNSEAVVRRIPAAAFESVITGSGTPSALSATVGARLARWAG